MVPEKKRKGRPPTTGRGAPLLVRLHADDLAAIDAWRREQPDPPTRPEAVRRLVRKALGGE